MNNAIYIAGGPFCPTTSPYYRDITPHHDDSSASLDGCDIGASLRPGRYRSAAMPFGGGPAECVCLGAGVATPVGFVSDGAFLLPTTLFGVNPDYWDAPRGGGYRTAEPVDYLRSLHVRAVPTRFASGIVCINEWDRNYQHFLTETFPRLHIAVPLARADNLPLIVLDHPHIRDIMDVCFPDISTVFVSENTPAELDRAYFIMPLARNFGEILPAQIDAFKLLREAVADSARPDAPRRGFLCRRTVPGNAGHGRQIDNEAALAALMQAQGFEFFHLDEQNVRHKARVMRQYSAIVSPIGANLMNLVFCQGRVDIMVLLHPFFQNTDWFFELFGRLGIEGDHRRFAQAAALTENGPYTINVAALAPALEEFSPMSRHVAPDRNAALQRALADFAGSGEPIAYANRVTFNRLTREDVSDPHFCSVPAEYSEFYGEYAPGHPFEAVRTRIDADRGVIEQTLALCRPFMHHENLWSVAQTQQDAVLPFWRNSYFSGADAKALYAMAAALKPARVMEIGIGNSTKFLRKAITDFRLPTTIHSIDPAPRADVTCITDELIEQSIHTVDTARFAALAPGDFVFLDGTHQVINGSDLPRFFLEILPVIPPGVYIHLHDITLPFCHWAEFHRRYFSEIYILAAALLFSDRFEVALPVTYLHARGELDEWGSSFWMRKIR